MGTLIFLLTFLLLICCIVTISVFLIRGKWRKALKVIGALIGILVSYIILLLFFSLTSITTILPLHQAKCFDEWCAAIDAITKTSTINNDTYAIHMTISNKGRGRAQKPDQPNIYVIDEYGNIYTESNLAQETYQKQYGLQRPVTSRIDAQSSYNTTILYSLPKNRKGYVVITEGGFPTPLIIGDEGSLFHKKSVTPLTTNN